VRVTEICPGRVATDIFAHVHGDSAETYERFVKGFELPQAKDIADAIAFAITRPWYVCLNEILIRPTEQKG
jgi:NADP-dependent 3-hydroxy acid dehydrogenase YdfG